MSRSQRVRRPIIAGFAGVLLVLGWPLSALAAVVEGLVSEGDAARGLGWAVHPDQVGGGNERFVEGPLTPPSRRGSLEMTAPTSADRALIFTVPKPASGEPIGGIAAFIATPWVGTIGSFSTFTTNTAEPAASIPALLLVGFQVFDPENPVLSEEFTVLHVEGGFQTPGAAANSWQTWTLNDNTRVWQSDSTDDFCEITAPCTFGQFATMYSTGAWGQIQVGMGTGLPADSQGYVDNVQVSDGTTTFVADFENPAASRSTATIAAGAATATGGTVTVTLNSSPLAALGSTQFTVAFSATSATSPAPLTVPVGQSVTQTYTVPFGTTAVSVQAQGATLASAPITFQPPTTTTIATPTPPTTTPTVNTAPDGDVAATELAATGLHPAFGLAVALTMLGAGLALIGNGLALVSPRRGKGDG